MSSAFNSNNQNSSSGLRACRRKGRREPLPVEVQIQINDRVISGIVRDVSLERDDGKKIVGISLMHFEPLSVHREYICRTVQPHKRLPNEFTVSIRWCRYFEDEAFISGGVVE